MSDAAAVLTIILLIALGVMGMSILCDDGEEHPSDSFVQREGAITTDGVPPATAYATLFGNFGEGTLLWGLGTTRS